MTKIVSVLRWLISWRIVWVGFNYKGPNGTREKRV